MIFETEFMKLYEELGEINSDLDEAKKPKNNNSKSNVQSIADKIESFCTPLNEVMPNMPIEQSGFLFYVTPKFIKQYKNDFLKVFPQPDLEWMYNKIRLALSYIDYRGQSSHKDLGTEHIVDISKVEYACRFDRIAGTPVRSHRIIVHDPATGKKYFILASLFVHAKEKWTDAEAKQADDEFDTINQIIGKR
jgi:hypothetical protein